MSWRDVEPSEDVGVASWIAERMHGFAMDVGSIVPSGFEAYARIFHPAWEQRHEPDDPEAEVRWSTVAEWNGKVVHPEMQFHSIAGLRGRAAAVDEPRLGVLSERQSRALVEILARHTATPDACWMCLWDGYGDLHPGPWAVLVTSKPGVVPPPIPPRTYPPQRERVRLPARDYLLFHGAVGQAAGWDEGPNLWWPEDQAWCVASEIDFPYTYVGGSKVLVDEILRDADLEALPAKLTDGVAAVSDTINA